MVKTCLPPADSLRVSDDFFAGPVAPPTPPGAAQPAVAAAPPAWVGYVGMAVIAGVVVLLAWMFGVLPSDDGCKTISGPGYAEEMCFDEDGNLLR